MSNTGIAPSVASATLAGNPIALANGFAPVNNMAWAGLAQGAVGAPTPIARFKQAKFTVSGTFGAYGALVLQASPDGVNWTSIAEVNDPVLAGSQLANGGKEGGFKVITQPNGVIVVAVTDSNMDGFRYLQPVVQGGDGTTSLNVVGQISSAGAV